MAIDWSLFAIPKVKQGQLEPWTCVNCGAAFTRRWASKTRPEPRFCGKLCATTYQGRKNWKPKPPCPVCGGRVLSGCQRCCSKRCMVIASRTLRPKTCRQCRTTFTPAKSGQPFCTMKCWRAFRSADFVMVTCAQCARSFRKSRRACRSRQRQHFCNRACLRKFQSVPEHAPHWRGGHDPNRGPRWLKLAASIRDRDGHVCTRCGRTEAENGQKLDVDHILPWRVLVTAGIDVANAPSNLTSLCRKCHRWKTTTVEKAWLERGDCLQMSQYERSVKLPPLFQGAV